MPVPHSPQPFKPRPAQSFLQTYLWLVPGGFALVFVMVMATWAEVNDVQLQRANDQTLLFDALSVEAQLHGRQEMESVRLRSVASRLPRKPVDANASLQNMPEVVAGLDRLWNRLVWLDDNNRLVARAERQTSQAVSGTDDLRIQSSGQAHHLSVPILDARGQGAGKLLARFELADLLKSTDLGWLNRRYEVNFISELGEVIATSANPVRRPEGRDFERPLAGFNDTLLRLTPYESTVSWRQNPKTLALLSGLLLLGLAGSQLTRQSMRQVNRAVTEAQTEAAWRQSMEDSALVGLRARNAQGRILYVNKTLCDMVGYNANELVGLIPPLPFWPPDAVDAMMARNLNTLAGGAPSTGFETRWRHRDGRLIDVMIFESRLVNSQGEHIGWMGSIIDISERRRLEDRDRIHTEALAQHARLNDMGLLASELAHELNQPLTTILSYSAGLTMSLKRAPGMGPEDLAAMEEVNRHARKAGDIVNWIRRQTSRSTSARTICDLNAIVSEVVGLRMRQVHRASAQLTLDLTSAGSWVMADRIGVEQVVTNLIRNAVDAVTGRAGDRSIRVTSKRLRGEHDADALLEITVGDSGAGLRGRTLDMLCTTFYTTKNDGMGLGLGICRAIIESHGGSLHAEDSPNGGAQFRFTLAAAEAPTSIATS